MRSARFWRQWGWPSVLWVLTLVGLLSALFGEGGLWWLLSWLALATPVATVMRHTLWPGRQE